MARKNVPLIKYYSGNLPGANYLSTSGEQAYDKIPAGYHFFSI
jgi:hypothetical protein